MEKIINFFKDEEGVTAIEYGLIAALVAVVIIVGLNILGPALRDIFSGIGNEVQDQADTLT
jgi:pilus assembly protein Flp/PilA